MTGQPLQHAPDLALVENDDQVVVLRLSSLAEPPVVLEGTGATIWRLIDGARDLDALVVAVADLFHETAHRVQPDVTLFVEGLRATGLLSETPAPA